MIREYDVVKLIRPLPERGIEAGAEGTVVMVYEPGIVEVEFADARGVTQALVTLSADVLEVTWSPSDE